MKQDHIIQKVFVEITVNNKEKAYQIKQDISSFLAVDVFPAIERYIGEMGKQSEGYTLQIPRLELNLDVRSSSLNAELKDKIARIFREELSEISQNIETSGPKPGDDSKPYRLNEQEKMVQTFIHFLETGSMPWWNSDKNNSDFMQSHVFENLTSAPTFRKSVISVLPKPHIQERVIHQLSDKQIAALCRIILEDKELKINLEDEVIRQISTLNRDSRTFIWRMVLRVLSQYLHSSNTNLREYLLSQISEIKKTEARPIKSVHKTWETMVAIFPFIRKHEITETIKNLRNTEKNERIKKNIEDNHDKPEITEKRSEQNNSTAQDELLADDGQFLQNAGLILIHPFLKTFFEHCNLLNPKNQELTDPELCAHLLHYVATGKTNTPEYEMTFEKFLCHIPANQTINRHRKLSRIHKMQAKNLIDSVKHNWNPMKNSSTALLQNEFFQRPGKLVITDYDYTLTVERKAQDILLDKLSWGIGLVKLPWKDRFVFVNW